MSQTTVPPGTPAGRERQNPDRSSRDRSARPPRANGARGNVARKPRGEGQWALGYREPLNANEQSKKDDNPLNVRARIENIYAHKGFASIDPADLRGRFRWMGLYTQRRPGIDGGRTATLEPEELEDEYFMLRVRIDGGALDLARLRTIAGISQAYGRNTADLTDRQNIQLHWVRIEDVPTIWERLEAVGLQTTEACGDCPRVVLGSPLAGIAADEIVDPTPALEAIKTYIGDPEFSNLPRKYKTALTGLPNPDVVPEANDIAFVGAVHPEHGPGFDIWVGGGLSTNPRLADRLGAWCAVEDAARVWWGVTSIFRDYGYRRLRNRARLKYLLADWGVARFREVLETEYLKRPLADLAPPPAPVSRTQRGSATPLRPLPDTGDHVGVHAQRDGRMYVGVTPTVGRISGELLGALADVVEAHGGNRVRTTPFQKLVVLDIEPERVESLVTALRGIGLEAFPSYWRRSAMACTGIQFCKLAIVETKDRATELVAELERRVPELDTPITVHLNGCPNSCARIQVADIGLKGQIVTDTSGEQVEGYQVHLGGHLGFDPVFGRKLRGHKVTSHELPDYVERVVRRYLAAREPGEAFAAWAGRAPEEALR